MIQRRVTTHFSIETNEGVLGVGDKTEITGTNMARVFEEPGN